MERITNQADGKVTTVDTVNGQEVTRTYSDKEWFNKQNPTAAEKKAAHKAEADEDKAEAEAEAKTAHKK